MSRSPHVRETSLELAATNEAVPASFQQDSLPIDSTYPQSLPIDSTYPQLHSGSSRPSALRRVLSRASSVASSLLSPTATSPTAVDLACPICLDVLVRPVELACGHKACRFCLMKHLQTGQQRKLAHDTGKAACPLGRCQIEPTVPKVDTCLQVMLEARFAARLATRSVRMTPDEEASKAEEINEWVSAGCTLAADEVVVTIPTSTQQEPPGLVFCFGRLMIPHKHLVHVIAILVVVSFLLLAIAMILILDPSATRKLKEVFI